MANKKLKLLYLAQYLQEETDERHPKTMQDMIAYLERCGISAERKSLYDDLDALRQFGIDILSVKHGGSYGYYVQIDHGGGLETLYAHCSSICVTTGQQVQSGEVIGYVGHTGRATGNHLHLEVSVDGNRADVLRYFTL